MSETAFVALLIIASAVLGAIGTWLAMAPRRQGVIGLRLRIMAQAQDIERLRRELGRRPEYAAELRTLDGVLLIEELADDAAVKLN